MWWAAAGLAGLLAVARVSRLRETSPRTSTKSPSKKSSSETSDVLIGVIGGLGPEASARFLQHGVVGGRIRLAREGVSSSHARWTSEEYDSVKSGSAVIDQDHIPIVLVSAPDVPPRPAFILGRSTVDPAPALGAAAERLMRAGCTHVAMVCATAHYFISALEETAKSYPGVEILDMINIGFRVAREATLGRAVADSTGRTARVGILATRGAISTPVFWDRAKLMGLELVTPEHIDVSEQDLVEEVIFSPTGIKAGFDKLETQAEARASLVKLARRASRLAQRIAELNRKDPGGLKQESEEIFVVVLACTELPLILTDESVDRWGPELRSEGLDETDLKWLKRVRFVDLAKALADDVVRLSLLSRVARE